MQRQTPDLKDLNARWGTQFANWNEVEAPPVGASSRYLLDWLVCMRGSIGGLLMDLARSIRHVAPDRLIVMYTDGLDDAQLKELNTMGGVMLADGGSQRPEVSGCSAMALAMYGLHRRTEPIGVTIWEWIGSGLSRLDSSLYSMLLAGGGNANCKMFIPAGKNFDEIRKNPFSLDRFERFLPIWNELRATNIMPRSAFILNDWNASMLESGSTRTGGDTWTEMCAMEAGVLAPIASLEMAAQGKFLFLPRIDAYEKSVVEGLAHYVEKGGTLMLCADTGRHSPDLPQEDWVLLRRLGFGVPSGVSQSGVVLATPVKGEIFQENAAPFTLRDIWTAPEDPQANIVARIQKSAQPVMTWKSLGKGRVVVIWANAILPAMLSHGYPFVRDIARWAGVRSYAESDSPSLWTNLVKHQNKDAFYGLVYHAYYHVDSPKIGLAISGSVKWFLPAGKYKITELISGKALGMQTAADLGKQGVATKLEQGEVAIYRMELVR